ncbi:hypothetical protein ACFFU8_09060 [Chromobacterium piscinae]|uniref:hypothetical protein n=1 Tax=Chromobacterium piscinae TaxID=686831 RepID=UPI001E56575E|nr:hypothetical protein [Chromobacterium piscinae]MCD5327947.1 hypothetical protein [Chromobacterium piscinae]
MVVLQGYVPPVSVNASVCEAKTQFTNDDLRAVELDPSEVPEEMRCQAFTLGTALPWFQIISERAAEALLDM